MRLLKVCRLVLHFFFGLSGWTLLTVPQSSVSWSDTGENCYRVQPTAVPRCPEQGHASPGQSQTCKCHQMNTLSCSWMTFSYWISLFLCVTNFTKCSMQHASIENAMIFNWLTNQIFLCYRKLSFVRLQSDKISVPPQRIAGITSMLQQSLEGLLIEGLQTSNVDMVRHCLRTYATIDKTRDAEALVGQVLVKPYMDQVEM